MCCQVASLAQIAKQGQRQNAAAAQAVHPQQQQDAGGGGSSSNYGNDRTRALIAALLKTSATAAIDALGSSPPGSGSGTGTAAASMAADLASRRRLAGVMAEMGPQCCASEAQVVSLLGSMQPLDERAVAEVLGLWARAPKGVDEPLGLAGLLSQVLDPKNAGAAAAAGASSSSWNWRLVVDKLKAAAPGLAWRRVAEQLDHDSFRVAGAPGFDVLAAAYAYGAGEQLPLPDLAAQQWANKEGQLSLLATAATAPSTSYDWDSAGGARVAPLDAAGSGGAWGSVDLADALCKLAEAGHFAAVRQLLDAPLQACPDMLLLAAVSARAATPPPAWGMLERQLLTMLTGNYLAGSAARSSSVLARLWASHPSALVHAMVDWASAAPGRLPRISDVCHELQATAQVRGAGACCHAGACGVWRAAGVVWVGGGGAELLWRARCVPTPSAATRACRCWTPAPWASH